MGPGPIFCCYVLKLRMPSFLQNGAWPHLFSRLRSPLGSDFVIMLRVGLHFVFEHYRTIKSDPEEPCPLSLSHGFSPYSHRQKGTRRSRASSMSERRELRSRREERMENGVNNLIGSEDISKNLFIFLYNLNVFY